VDREKKSEVDAWGDWRMMKSDGLIDGGGRWYFVSGRHEFGRAAVAAV